MRWKDWPGSSMARRGSYSEALLRLVKALNETGIRYALTGAAAVGYYGIPGSSIDIDVVISGNLSDAQVEALAGLCQETGSRSAGMRFAGRWVTPCCGSPPMFCNYRPGRMTCSIGLRLLPAKKLAGHKLLV